MRRGFYNYKKHCTGINTKTFSERLKQLESQLMAKFCWDLWEPHALRAIFKSRNNLSGLISKIGDSIHIPILK